MDIWVIDLNYKDVGLTFGIGVGVMLIGLVLFKLLWLNSPYFEVPTGKRRAKYNFSMNAGYLTKMSFLIGEILNHEFWIEIIGYDGELTSLHLPSLPSEDHHHTDHVWLCLCYFLLLLLSYCKDRVIRVC